MDHERRLAIEQRLQALEVEKCALQEELKDLTFKPVKAVPIITENITQHASESEKIALFRSLFRGREDVFPHRWHNAKTGKSGYSPVCGNEWVKGICEKPKVKCGECPNQRFIPVSDAIIRNHLRGKDLGLATVVMCGYFLVSQSLLWMPALWAHFPTTGWSNF